MKLSRGLMLRAKYWQLLRNLRYEYRILWDMYIHLQGEQAQLIVERDMEDTDERIWHIEKALVHQPRKDLP